MIFRAFTEVLYFLTKLGHRPFLKRYLKRDEIQASITFCDALLNDALGMFGVSTRCDRSDSPGGLTCFVW